MADPTSTLTNGNPSIGLGILSWKARKTLRASLESHREAGLLDMFDDALIFFQEIEDEDRALAAEFGIRAEGTDENLGIMGGIKKIAELLQTDYVLYLENDYPTIADNATLRRQFTTALAHMESGAVKYTLLDENKRHEAKEPQSPLYKRYIRFHPSPALGEGDTIAKKIQRVLLPHKANRAAWPAVYLGEADRFPHLMQPIEHGYFALAARALAWTNQAPFFPRQWFLQELIPLAESTPSSRSVNGKPDLEKDTTNRRWWREQPWRIGISNEGLFLHSRIDRPEGDEKTALSPRE